jgi:hypothetical protein
MKLRCFNNSINDINNQNFNNFLESSKTEKNNFNQNEYLNKYHNLFGDSFSDIELLDIFAKNNYNDNKIISDIKSLLSIGYENKTDNDNNNRDKNYSPSFRQNSKIPESKIKYIKNDKNSSSCSSKNDKRIFQKETDFSTDYENEIKKDMLLEYKKRLFNNLKKVNYSYKTNKIKNDEALFNNILRKKDESTNKNEIRIIELSKKKSNLKNKSPSQDYQYYQKYPQFNSNENINKELKNKYIKEFFGQMKNYSKNIETENRRNKMGKSPDFGTRKNILEISPDKLDLQKNLTYKRRTKKNYYNYNSSYNYIKIESKVNNIFISACYDNPQREVFLKMINEKRKKNPDKIVQVLFPQFPPMGYYPNVYQQYNPYMNTYMLQNSQQFPPQNPLIGIPLNNEYTNQVNNNDLNAPMCDTQDQDTPLKPNNEINIYSKIRTSVNMSNSGNINTTSSLK